MEVMSNPTEGVGTSGEALNLAAISSIGSSQVSIYMYTYFFWFFFMDVEECTEMLLT